MWDVREIRDTRHGFALHFGWPEGCRGKGFGGPRLIPTRELSDYFERTALQRDGSIYDLPAAGSTIKRIRALLGFNYYDANAEWWQERLEDLINLSGRRFAQAHGVSEETVAEMRVRLFGRRLREPHWYEEKSSQLLLVGPLPRAYVAERLGISLGSVGRLRWLLRRKQSEENGRVTKWEKQRQKEL